MRRKSKLADSWTRRELFRKLGKGAGASAPACLARILAGCGGSSTSAPPGDGYPGTDDQLMEEIEKAGFLFFWEQADPNTGQVKDRALAAGNDTRTISSIAATGFGLTALCIGDQRQYALQADIVSRVQATLQFLAGTMQPAGKN